MPKIMTTGPANETSVLDNLKNQAGVVPAPEPIQQDAVETVEPEFEKTEPMKKQVGNLINKEVILHLEQETALYPNSTSKGLDNAPKPEDMVPIRAEKDITPPPQIGDFRWSEEFSSFSKGTIYMVPKFVAAVLLETKAGFGGR